LAASRHCPILPPAVLVRGTAPSSIARPAPAGPITVLSMIVSLPCRIHALPPHRSHRPAARSHRDPLVRAHVSGRIRPGLAAGALAHPAPSFARQPDAARPGGHHLL